MVVMEDSIWSKMSFKVALSFPNNIFYEQIFKKIAYIIYDKCF